jgi:D-alanyl-D-alanine carboxypeptidase/D-alanyl-D-alanine-endopeptidase (penicillin-binding protein 4)
MGRGCTGWTALALLAASPAGAQDGAPPSSIQTRIEARLAQAGPGTRFGLVIATEDGRELVAIAPEGRFVPASTTKMFTTAAAFANLPGLDRPDTAGGASVRLDPGAGGLPNVVLEGHGDARLSGRDGCVEDCRAALADAVAAKVRAVRDVIGDDSLFPDQRWSPGMSWNNIPTSSGTATSALTLDDNELPLVVTPSAPGARPRADMPPYYERLPGSRALRLTGAIPADAKPERMRLGIDDPADYAAWRLKALLQARGVRVAGTVVSRHRPLPAPDAPAPKAARTEILAQVTPPPLLADLHLTLKISQNLHAELFLRRLGRLRGGGSIADGLAVVRSMLDGAGVPPRAADFSDGSGMSTYNRVSPRGAVTFLRWVGAQPWGTAWRAALPVGGEDGTLTRRFRGGPLQGRIFAKTGTLNQASALAGYMVAKSGRTLIFAAYANDMPEGMNAVPAIDAALEMAAAEN